MHTMYEEEARDEASGFIGREITDLEWNTALPQAQKKLDSIIQREGDADGIRRLPSYLGMLVEEIITSTAITRLCEEMGSYSRKEHRHETAQAHT